MLHTWTCNGVYGGPSVSCSANRRLNGVCGAAKTIYGCGETSFRGSFCDPGNPNPPSPTFPDQGKIATWLCGGINEGSSATCIANRENAITATCVYGTKTCIKSISEIDTSMCGVGNTPSDQKYFAGEFTWTCGGNSCGTPPSASCTLPQCAIYKEVAP